ncbi:MAG: CpsB/CapC family capsule biosynthesis tyrosine phosphatase [Gemmatimonadales bacterium]
MIDIHNHLLPNLDDGSRSSEQSVAVLSRFRDEGVVAVVCTPHLSASSIAVDGEKQIVARDQALFSLRGRVAGVELHPGFEIMLDQPLPPIAVGDRRYALAGSRYYLVEFPLRIAGEFTTAVLQQMTSAGVVPVVAHPERYRDCTMDTVAAWKQAGCVIQVDATTLTSSSGRGQCARAYVEAGLADVLAADNHGDGRGLWTGRDYVQRCKGARVQRCKEAEVLTSVNPGRVIADRVLEPVEPMVLRRTLVERIKEIW